MTFPTKTRLALLQAVADGVVVRRFPLGPGPAYDELYRPREELKTVTARCRELAAAGWIQPGEPTDTSYGSPRPWVLTDVGREVLEANR